MGNYAKGCGLGIYSRDAAWETQLRIIKSTRVAGVKNMFTDITD